MDHHYPNTPNHAGHAHTYSGPPPSLMGLSGHAPSGMEHDPRGGPMAYRSGTLGRPHQAPPPPPPTDTMNGSLPLPPVDYRQDHTAVRCASNNNGCQQFQETVSISAKQTSGIIQSELCFRLRFIYLLKPNEKSQEKHIYLFGHMPYTQTDINIQRRLFIILSCMRLKSVSWGMTL